MKRNILYKAASAPSVVTTLPKNKTKVSLQDQKYHRKHALKLVDEKDYHLGQQQFYTYNPDY